MIKIGITGSLASGKTTASKILSQRRGPLFSADKAVKELYKNKKLPNKILLSGEKGIGKSTLAYHIINHILSIDEDYSYDFKNFRINPQ